MDPQPFPRFADWVNRWRSERALQILHPLFGGLSGTLILLLLALALLPSTREGLQILAALTAFSWLTAGGLLLAVYCRSPTLSKLAKRVDAVLALPDDLLSLIEQPQSPDPWREATLKKVQKHLDGLDLQKSWPLRAPRWTWPSGMAALLLTFAIASVGWMKWTAESQRLAALAAAQEQRVAVAEELMKDWEEFAAQTEDPELKKLFIEAAKLKEAFKDTDPRASMLAINELQSKMQEMESAIANESLASQAEQMAEALEAFEGMAAMSAALRNQNFEAAAREAEKLAAELKQDPNGQTALRREAMVAEMLATESKKAGQRGNKNLEQTLSQFANSAQTAKGSTPNSELAPPTESLRNQFSQEAARQNRGRAASTGKQQLDSLRERLQGESPEDSPFPSLCKSLGDKPGGQGAGSSTTGSATGDATELPEAGVQESLTGKMSEGDSEIKTTASSSGSATAIGGGKPSDFSQYAELSQQAVADENLPLAHRRVIRTYFERIRPIAETPKP